MSTCESHQAHTRCDVYEQVDVAIFGLLTPGDAAKDPEVRKSVACSHPPDLFATIPNPRPDRSPQSRMMVKERYRNGAD